jgi:hypothetical protein
VMIVEESIPFALGVDTVMELSTQSCRVLVREGIHFAVRYLGRVTPDEVGRILCSGLAFMPVTTSRGHGWVPSKTLGLADGVNALGYLSTLGIPKGCTVWLDLEGCSGPAEATAAWVNAWSWSMRDAGYEAGLYVGSNPGGLDSEALWKLPSTTRYWRSCSRVPEPANRGWCMQQLKPWNYRYGNLTVDFNVIENDYFGDRPKWVVG